MHKTRQWWERDRHVSRQPRKGRFYCYSCDACLIGTNQRCPVCGNRDNGRRDKRTPVYEPFDGTQRFPLTRHDNSLWWPPC